MEVAYVAIVPIGGIVAIFGILSILALVGIWQALTSNSQVFINFANEHTDIVLIAFAVAAVLEAVIIVILLAEEQNGHKKSSVPTRICQASASAVPTFFSLCVLYSILIELGHSVLGTMSGMILFIVAIFFTLPVCIVVFCVLLLIVLGINILPFWLICEGSLQSTGGKILTYAINAATLIAAIYVLNSHTNFLSYLSNSFLLP